MVFAAASQATAAPDVKINDDGSGAQQLDPMLASATDGIVHIVWLDDRDGDDAIYYAKSTDHAVSWGTNVRVTDDTGANQANPSLAVDGSDLYVVWEDYRGEGGPDIFFSHSDDGGSSWGPDVPIKQGPEMQDKPKIAVDDTGALHVVWEDARDPEDEDIYYAKSMDQGESWTELGRINDDSSGQDQHLPDIAIDDSGTVHVVWQDHRDDPEGNDIYAAVSSDRGMSWSANVHVNPDAGGKAFPPPVDVDGRGVPFLAWRHDTESTSDVYYGRSDDGGATWSPGGPVNEAVGVGQYNIHAAATGENVMAAAWHDMRNGDMDVFVSISTDGGATWSSDVRANDDDGSDHQGEPFLEFGPTGRLYVAWTDSRDGDDEDLWTTTIEPPRTPLARLAVHRIPSPLTAGTPATVTVEARDKLGNVVNDYTGTVTFASSDAEATLPSDYEFTAEDDGIHEFPNAVVLRTPGTQSVRVQDAADPEVSGEQAGIEVLSDGGEDGGDAGAGNNDSGVPSDGGSDDTDTDAGTAAGADGSGGGCSCRIDRPSAAPSWLVVGVAALAVLPRRRTRCRRTFRNAR